MSRIKKLTEAEFIRMFREEWQSKMQNLSEKAGIDLTAKVPKEKGTGRTSEEVPILSRGLKLRHRSSGILYTLHSPGEDECVLKTPEGKLFSVSSAKLRNEYERD